MQKYNHLFKNSAFLALLTTTLFSSPVKAASVFNLSFFDNSGNQVGTGTFTDTENTDPVCFSTSNDPNACSGQPWAGSHVDATHVVDNFSVYFPGEGGGLSGGTQWYYDSSNGQQPGSIAYSQYGPNYLGGSFFLQRDLHGTPPQFRMDFTGSTKAFATGTFLLSRAYATPLYGSFTAINISVPEPLNILGASIGLGLILGLKRKSP